MLIGVLANCGVLNGVPLSGRSLWLVLTQWACAAERVCGLKEGGGERHGISWRTTSRFFCVTTCALLPFRLAGQGGKDREGIEA